MEVLSKSGNGLVKPADPFSPIEKIWALDLLTSPYSKYFLTYLTIEELTAPQRPLSEVIGTTTTEASYGSAGIFLCIN